MTTTGPETAENPFLSPSALPYGLPDFAAIRTEHFRPAFAHGLAEAHRLLEELSAPGTPSTFEDLLEPLLAGSPVLERVTTVFFTLTSSDGTPELQEIETEIVPQLTVLEDAIFLSAELFAKVDALREDAGPLTEEQRTILERTHRRFVLRGAPLGADERTRLQELNGQISRAETAFSQAVTADMNDAAVHVTEESELAGLDEAQRASARTAAADRGMDGWLLTLILPTVQRLLVSLEDRWLRERLYRASSERGTTTWDLAASIAQLRAEKAHLLGFADFAALAVADRTAGTPEAVDELFSRTVGPAMARTQAEAERITEQAARDDVTEIAAWDWSFYSARVQAEDYAVDEAALRPFFVLDRVIEDGVLRAAGEVYGLRFRRREDLVPHVPQAIVWEVFDADGEPVGLFIGDYFTRETKRGGAWMNTLMDRSRREGTQPIVLNTLNLSRPADGEPAFVTLDEVRTLFHEFGHALHALLSDVEYREVAGTAVERDVVEFPSQVNEMWALRPGFVEVYARHVDTGEPVPAELLEKVRSAALWGEGFRTAEYLAAAVLDWRWHRLEAGTVIEDPHAFEAEQLAAAGLAHPLVAPRYRTGYFNHTFSGGYASGYYSYIWAEVFDADTVAWYEEQLAAGTPVREAGRAFAEGILSIGGSRDLVAAYRDFRGRDRDVRFLLERRGLAGKTS